MSNKQNLLQLPGAKLNENTIFKFNIEKIKDNKNQLSNLCV